MVVVVVVVGEGSVGGGGGLLAAKVLTCNIKNMGWILPAFPRYCSGPW